MKTVELLIGVVCSGKSTWREKYITPETVVVSSDDIIQAYAAENDTTYDAVFKEYIGTADAQAKETFHNALASGAEHIVVDRTNVSRKSRQYWVKPAKEAGYRVIARVFPVPTDDILEQRLASRPGKSIPMNVVQSMKENFTVPRGEGFDEIVMESNGVDAQEPLQLKYKVSDLLDAFDTGEVTIIAHQANCFCAMGAGIAPLIAARWPKAKEADDATLKGDKKKLGHFTMAGIDYTKAIFNLYGQFTPGKATNYEALENAMIGMSNILAPEKEHVRIGFPKLGCGIGGGDWATVEAMIKEHFVAKGFNTTVYVLNTAELPQWVADPA